MATSSPSATDATDTTAIPAELCEHRVDAVLSPGSVDSADGTAPTFLASGPGGRAVVLKALDNDCLLKKGALHPSIRDRLARVRELALTGVANLYGVERDAEHPQHGHHAWLVWEYVPGQTFDRFAASPGRTQREVAAAARELILTVESLNLLGIVHGSIRSGNVIVNPEGPHGGVRLTHVSPLLYTDPAEDAQGVAEVLLDAVRRRGEEQSPLGEIVSRTMREAEQDSWRDAPAILRRLGDRLAAVCGAAGPAVSREAGPPESADGDAPDAAPRRRSLLGAVALAVLSLAAAYAIWALVGRPSMPASKPVPDTIDVR